MKKQPQNINTDQHRLHTLPVLSLPEFTNISVNDDYAITFHKIGDSILYTYLKGNLKHYSFEKEVQLSQDFKKASKLHKPYVDIIDLSEATDYIHFANIKKLMRYFYDNQDIIHGVVLINNPSWLNAFIKHGLRYYNPDFEVALVHNYDDAVNKALLILNKRGAETPAPNGKPRPIRYQDIHFRREWEYHNHETGLVYRIGCIPNLLLYTSMEGVIGKSDDIVNAFALAVEVINENSLKNIPWVITDFSQLDDVKSFRLRQQFLIEAKNVLKDSGNAKAFRIFINPGRFNRIIIRLFAPYVISDYFIADSIEQAIDKINEISGAGKATSDVDDIHVSAAHLEEVSDAFVSLLSFDDCPDNEIKVSQHNPLSYLIESLELVKNDFRELRANELKLQQERLKASEDARVAIQREEEERRILLDNIPTQVWYLTNESTYGTVNKAHADFMGVSASDLEYKNYFDVLPRDKAEEYTKINQQVFTTGKVVHLEAWALNANKISSFLSITLTPRLRKDGKVDYVVCSAEDITERWHSQEVLKESENKLRQVIDLVPHLIFARDDQGRYLMANTAIAEVYGTTPANLIGKTDYDFNKNLEEVKHFLDDDRKVLERGVKMCFLEKVSGPGGTRSFLETTKIPFTAYNHGKPSLLGISVDITDRVMAEEALRESEARLRLLSNNLPNGMIYQMVFNINDHSSQFTYVSEGVERIHGVTAAEVLKDASILLNQINPEDHAAYALKQAMFIENLTPIKLELRITTPQGVAKWIMLAASPRKGGESKIIWEGLVIDITELKEAERKNRENEARLHAFVANQPGIAFIVDKNGVFMLSEGRGLAKIGLKPGEVVGRSVFEVYKDLPETQLQMKKALEGEEQFLTVKIEEVIFETWLVPLFDERGGVTGVIGISSDITARVQSDEIRQQLEIARKTTQFKQNFLAKMSHEIRTPLTGVLGMIDILEQTPLTIHQKDYLNTMKTSGDNLRFIINQVLEYSKIEAGKIIINPVVFEFETLPEMAVNLYKDTLHAGVRFIIDSDPAIPPVIKADQARLLQVLNNLVSNAVKFTHEGWIRIHSLLMATPPSTTPMIRMEVIDTGRGMSAELQEKLFSPFVQGEESTEGTGLGLSICKELVALMGGLIGVDSEEGKGSRFWFTFPAGEVVETDSGRGKLTGYDSGRKLSILLTEDSRVIQKFATLLLNSMGHTVSVAVNGRQALDMFEPGKFDLILMDVQMPVMDGVTATQKLKEKYTNLPPIVGLSANAFEGDPEKYISLGMDDYLTKPFNKEDFERMLARVMRG